MSFNRRCITGCMSCMSLTVTVSTIVECLRTDCDILGAKNSVFMCFVWISEQTAIISLYNINWLVCITETESVYCAVRTGYLTVINVEYQIKSADSHHMYTLRRTTSNESETLCSYCHQVTLKRLDSREGREIFRYSAACRPVCSVCWDVIVKSTAAWVCHDDQQPRWTFTGATPALQLAASCHTWTERVRWQGRWQQDGCGKTKCLLGSVEMRRHTLTTTTTKIMTMMMMMMMIVVITSYDCTKFELLCR